MNEWKSEDRRHAFCVVILSSVPLPSLSGLPFGTFLDGTGCLHSSDVSPFWLKSNFGPSELCGSSVNVFHMSFLVSCPKCLQLTWVLLVGVSLHVKPPDHWHALWPTSRTSNMTLPDNACCLTHSLVRRTLAHLKVLLLILTQWVGFTVRSLSPAGPWTRCLLSSIPSLCEWPKNRSSHQHLG